MELSGGSEGPAVIWVCIYVSLSNSTCQMGWTCSSPSLPSFFFLPLNFSAEQSVFFHSALGDDSLGLLWFILSRIRAGRLLIIFSRLSSFVCLKEQRSLRQITLSAVFGWRCLGQETAAGEVGCGGVVVGGVGARTGGQELCRLTKALDEKCDGRQVHGKHLS